MIVSAHPVSSCDPAIPPCPPAEPAHSFGGSAAHLPPSCLHAPRPTQRIHLPLYCSRDPVIPQ